MLISVPKVPPPPLAMLYPELLFLITEHLQRDRASISRLAAVSKMTHSLLLSALYADVTLYDATSIALFCRTLMSSSTLRYGDLVQKLWIGPTRPAPFREIALLVDQIRTALNTLRHLRCLTLTPTTPLFGRLFVGLECPFQLRQLVCASHPDAHFASFLQRQPSITSLELGDLEMSWGARSIVSLVNHYQNYIISGLPFLPHLTSLVAEPVTLVSLCVGRPIHRVGIHGPAGTVGKALAMSIAQSAAPICAIAVEIRSVDDLQNLLLRILEPLKSTPVVSTLKELKVSFQLVSVRTIALPPHCANIDAWIQNRGEIMLDSLESSFMNLEWLEGFECLEVFEFSSSSENLWELKQGHGESVYNRKPH